MTDASAIIPDCTAASGPGGATPLSRITDLREVLAEKFPGARVPGAPEPAAGGILLSLGCAAPARADLPSAGEAAGRYALRRGIVTELSSTTGSGALFLDALLAAAQRERTFLALIDAGRSFDPQSYESAALARLLWVQCDTAHQAVKAADLLVRDGNLPLLALDLQALPRRALARVPASTWHRFHRLIEQTATAFVILTSQPMIEGAKVRVAIHQRWALHDLRDRRQALMGALELRTFARGKNGAQPALQRIA